MNSSTVVNASVVMTQQQPLLNQSNFNNNINPGTETHISNSSVPRDQNFKEINNNQLSLTKTNFILEQESPTRTELMSPSTSQPLPSISKENKKYIDGNPPDHSQNNISNQYVPKRDDSINSSLSSNTRKAASHSGSICFNCKTDTTPLWRRDEDGNTLCNACGLFLKLHGTPRPINLKTSVIKPRNRKSNSHRNFSAAKMFRGNFHLNNPFQTGTINGNRISKQCFRDIDIFPPRDSESIKRFKTSLVREEEPGKSEYPAIIKATQYIKPPLKPKFTTHEKDGFCNGRRYSFPTDNENDFIGRIHLPIPSILDPNLKKPTTNSRFTNLSQKGNASNLNNGSLSSSGSESECPKNSANNSNVTLSEYLSNEEEVIKLRTRIKELELVTDLYKDYIFRINEKCQHLEAVIQSTYNHN